MSLKEFKEKLETREEFVAFRCEDMNETIYIQPYDQGWAIEVIHTDSRSFYEYDPMTEERIIDIAELNGWVK